MVTESGPAARLPRIHTTGVSSFTLVEEGPTGEVVVERLAGGEGVEEPEQVDGRPDGQEAEAARGEGAQSVVGEALAAGQVVECGQGGVLGGGGAAGGEAEVQQVGHGVLGEQHRRGRPVRQPEVAEAVGGELGELLVGAGHQCDQVGAGGLGDGAGVAARPAGQVDEALDGEQLAGRVRPTGEESDEGMQAAITGQELLGERGAAVSAGPRWMQLSSG